MLQTNLSSKVFRHQAPPSALKTSSSPEDIPADTFSPAEDRKKDKTLSRTLKAMASLAVVMAPQMAHAAGADAAVQVAAQNPTALQEPEVIELAQQDQAEGDVVDSLKAGAEMAGEKLEQLKEAIDPNGYLNERKTKLGDWDFRFKPVDVDVKPNIKGGRIGLKARGDFLETEISRTEELGKGWEMREGVRGRLRGEAYTYKDNMIDAEGGVFREYRGTIKDEYDAKFSGEVGFRHSYSGGEEGLRFGLSLRQEIEGGDFEVAGQNFELYAEGRQSIHRNLVSNKTEVSYSAMVGPKKDFRLKLFGEKLDVSVAVGPEVRGNSQGEHFDLGVGSKVRVKLR